MNTLSKTIQLGVIILALGWLGKQGFPAPRLIAAVALALGVSRKTGYKAARRIAEILAGERAEREGAGALRRENTLLKIRLQMLRFERDHPAVRFAQRHRHLPAEARSLCVRLLREFKRDLSETEIASALGVPLSSLRRWEEKANERHEFPSGPERRGSHRRASEEDARRVREEFERLERHKTLEEFTEELNRKYPDRTLDRRTVTRLLQSEGLQEVRTKSPSGKRYHEKFEVYFPGAQVSLDATRLDVVFRSEEKVTVTKEVAVDIATSAIVGDALGRQENAEGVECVLVKVRQECRSVLAVLSDNGPANRAERVGVRLERECEVGQIFSFPYHPQTNGHIEGLFGQFSRIVGRIEIDDSSRESVARSVVEVIYRVFVHFHNYSPRERLGGLSPVDYLRRYVPAPAEREAAREGLEKRRERSRSLRQKHARLSDPAFRALVEDALERNRLDVPLERALGALRSYDSQVIASSANALFVQSQRDGFQETKRTFAYFMGIVRRKQKELDEDRLRSEIERQKTRRFLQESREHDRKVKEEILKEEEKLKTAPEEMILEYSRWLLKARLRYFRKTLLENLRRALGALRDLGRAQPRVLDQLVVTIRSWGEFGEDLKDQLVQLLQAEFEAVLGR